MGNGTARRMAARGEAAPPLAATAAAIPTVPPGDPADTEALGRRVAVGAAFMVAGRLAIRSVSVVSTLILVRLLVPEDFGLIALAASAFTVVDLLTATNYGLLLMRRPTVDKAAYDTAWTLNILRCLLLGGLVAGTARWQADLLGDPRLGPVLMVVASTVALDGFTSIGLTRLQRELKFDLVFRFQIAAKVVAFAVTIALAVALQNYFCLVLGNLAAKLVTIPYSYWLAPHSPRLSLKGAQGMLHFSKWMLAYNLCTVADANLSNLILGRASGLHAVGMFQIAYQVAAVPVTELAVPVRNPIYAGYAKAQNDIALLRRHVLAGFGFFCAVVTPLSVGIALTAPEVSRLALGPAWDGAVPLIALCALFALADSIGHFTFNVFVVLDAQDRLVRTYASLVALRLPAMVLAAAHAGAVGLVSALLATAVLNACVWHWRAARLLDVRLADVWAGVWRTFAAAAAMAVAVIGLRTAAPFAPDGSLGDAALELCALAAWGAGVQVGVQLLLWRLSGAPAGAERRLLSTLARAGARFAPRLFAFLR